MTPLTTDRDSQAIHDRAVKVLAGQGRSLDGCTAEEYLAAVEQAMSGGVLASSDLQSALGELGATDELVTEELLARRQQEILVERGLAEATPDGTVALETIARDERIDAMHQAIDELGKPGEPRKDGSVKNSVRAIDIVTRAVAAKAIEVGESSEYLRLMQSDREGTTRLLEAKGVDLTGIEGITPRSWLRDPELQEVAAGMAYKVDGRVLLPDEESARCHLTAVKLLKIAGLGDNYTSDQYAEVYETVVEAGGAAAADELLRRTSEQLVATGAIKANNRLELKTPNVAQVLSTAATVASKLSPEDD